MISTHPTFYSQTGKFGFMREFMKTIPENKLVMTQNNIAAHLTHQNVILLSLDFAKINPDTIAIDIRDGQNANNFFPLHPYEVNELVASISGSPRYKMIKINEQILFILQ